LYKTFQCDAVKTDVWKYFLGIVKNMKINAWLFIHRADILMHFNGPGRSFVGPGWVFSARAELYMQHSNTRLHRSSSVVGQQC